MLFRSWASDITYVETNEGVCYLSLITDLYSHKIVGWAVGPTLETVSAMIASAGYYNFISGKRDKLDLNAVPNIQLGN